MFSEQTLTEIRNRLSIVDLIQEYVQLKRSGQGYVGLCPFHKEKSPSFHVQALKQCFHCFGCQKGGNVFTFLSAVEGLSFPQAVEKLAQRAGVTIEHTRERRPQRVAIPGEDRLFAANDLAAKYFAHLLLKTPEFESTREYVKSRGLTLETIEKFRIGVSPRGWNALLTMMLKRGFKREELVQAGLVIEREGSPLKGYDRFRERLMFPITDPQGRVIAFGARLLTNEPNQPKYINSPESPLFSKRKVLYGLHENQRGIRVRGEAVIVEGYMDVVGLHQSGVDNAVATMGTAATEDHCAILRHLTKRVVTVFDPDAAGNDAWHRTVSLFMGAGIFAKDLTLPDAMDPDEYVQKESADAFYALCSKAPQQVTKLMREIAAKGPLSEQETGAVLSDLTPILIASRRMPDRAVLWDSITLTLNVSLNALKELVLGATGQAPNQKKSLPEQRGRGPISIPPKVIPLNPVDLEFFKACVAFPDRFLATPKELWIGGTKERSVSKWLEKLSATKNVTEFEKTLEDLVKTEADPTLLAVASARLLKVDAVEKPPDVEADAWFQSVLGRMGSRKREMEIKALSAQVKLTQRLGDDKEQLRLLEKLKELRST